MVIYPDFSGRQVEFADFWLDLLRNPTMLINILSHVAWRIEIVKDTIILEGRFFDCTKLVLQRFGLDDHTFRKLIKANIVPGPVTIGNKNFFDREEIESRILENCRQ